MTEVPYDEAQTLFGALTGVPVGSERMHTLTNHVAETLTVLSTWTKVLPRFTLPDNRSYSSVQTGGESLRPLRTAAGMPYKPQRVAQNT